MFSFGKAARLGRAEEFSEVRSRGIRARSGPILVSLLPGKRRRLGIAVTRQVGVAVQRNRIRRVIREFFRLHQETFPLGDCVVVPGRGSAALTNTQIREALQRALGLVAEKIASTGRGRTPA